MPEGGADLSRLAARLREAGDGGKGLRRELIKAIEEAAKPLADKIGSLEHLKPYLPDRYAAVLAGDLKVGVLKSLSGDPKVTIRAQAREHKRKVRRLDEGLLMHPVFAQGLRKTWTWLKEPQTAGMRPGFFADPCKESAPDVRDQLMRALHETARKIAGGP